MVFNRDMNAFAPLPFGAQPTDDDMARLRRQARAQGVRELRDRVARLFR